MTVTVLLPSRASAVINHLLMFNMSQQPATEPRNSQELTGTVAGKYRWDTWNGNGSQNPGLTWGTEAATVKHRPKAGSEPGFDPGDGKPLGSELTERQRGVSEICFREIFLIRSEPT